MLGELSMDAGNARVGGSARLFFTLALAALEIFTFFGLGHCESSDNKRQLFRLLSVDVVLRFPWRQYQ
jgi:hypothetical protein